MPQPLPVLRLRRSRSRREPEIPHAAYLDAVLAELGGRAGAFAGRRCARSTSAAARRRCGDPTASPRASAVGARRRSTPAWRPLEVTIEANPTDCTAGEPGRLARRRHQPGLDRRAVAATPTSWSCSAAIIGWATAAGRGRARAGGRVRALSADFILGAPPARPPAPAPTRWRAAACAPHHLSVYELTIEPSAPRSERRVRGAPVPRSTRTRWPSSTRPPTHRLEAAGYEHYEVSSYARPGRARGATTRCTGAARRVPRARRGAASFVRAAAGGGRALRPTTARSGATWPAPAGGAPRHREELGAGEMAADRAVARPAHRRRASPRRGARGGPGCADWLAEARAWPRRRRGDRMRPTLRGFLFADQVAARVVDWMYRYPSSRPRAMPSTSITERRTDLCTPSSPSTCTRGDAVGSRTVTRRHDIELSPATVRNVMADLEEIGLLEQPHTSAGRVPTESGLRFFIDSLLKVRSLSPKEKDEIRERYGRRLDLDEVFQRASRVLSRHHAPRRASCWRPIPSRQRFAHIEFVPLRDGAVPVHPGHHRRPDREQADPRRLRGRPGPARAHPQLPEPAALGADARRGPRAGARASSARTRTATTAGRRGAAARARPRSAAASRAAEVDRLRPGATCSTRPAATRAARAHARAAARARGQGDAGPAARPRRCTAEGIQVFLGAETALAPLGEPRWSRCRTDRRSGRSARSR